jgi:hypothetical protein
VREQGEGRTYSIWGIVAALVLLCVVGIVLLLLGVGSNGGTEVVPVPQTLPDRASTTTSEAPVELPEGVREVLRGDDTTSWVFDTPAAAADAAELSAVVAPLRVTVAADGRTASLVVDCARSSEEFLGQVVVTEGDTAVTFAAVALVAPGAPACVQGAAPREVGLTLPEPVGDRAVVVVPAGTELPELQPG